VEDGPLELDNHRNSIDTELAGYMLVFADISSTDVDESAAAVNTRQVQQH
jgi:hypothetical protein